MTGGSAELIDALKRRTSALRPRQRTLAGACLVYLAFYFLIDAVAIRRCFWVTPGDNSNVAEAESLLKGRLDLPWRDHDTALFEGKVYNVFPPMFTGIAAACLAFTPRGVPPPVMWALAAVLPGLAYALFLRRTRDIVAAMLLAVCYLAGTSVLPVIDRGVRFGGTWYVNHLLSQAGLLIFLLDWFGRRRLWLGGVGLLIAFWSRQLTVVYAAPLVLAAFTSDRNRMRWAGRALLGIVMAVMAGVPLLLNHLKFGDPLESGYRHLYAGRTDGFAQDAGQGLFALRFVPRNLYYMNLGLPEVVAEGGMISFKPDVSATGIWWTTPLLLYLVREWRRIWREPGSRPLLLAAGVVVALLLMYHATGGTQVGSNRFSLDYLVVLLSLIAPCIDTDRRKVTAALLTAWSVWYFRWAI